MPKRSRSGDVSSPARVVAPIERERLQRELDGACRRPFANHDVELKILHRGIQHFLDHGREPMDLVDEQHVARLQVGQQGGEIAGPFEHRPRGLAQVHAQLARQDVGERGLAQSRRTEDQRVIQRLAALDRRLHENLHLRLDLLLADIVGQPLRPDGAIDGLLFLRRPPAARCDRCPLFRKASLRPHRALQRPPDQLFGGAPRTGKGLEHLGDFRGLVAERHQRAPGFTFGLRSAIRQRRARSAAR